MSTARPQIMEHALCLSPKRLTDLRGVDLGKPDLQDALPGVDAAGVAIVAIVAPQDARGEGEGWAAIRTWATKR